MTPIALIEALLSIAKWGGKAGTGWRTDAIGKSAYPKVSRSSFTIAVVAVTVELYPIAVICSRVNCVAVAGTDLQSVKPTQMADQPMPHG
jgi:hypothetical protein